MELSKLSYFCSFRFDKVSILVLEVGSSSLFHQNVSGARARSYTGKLSLVKNLEKQTVM